MPCDYVLHTVEPVIYDKVRKEDEELLASCYEKNLVFSRVRAIYDDKI